ncbi:unnamed protein product, partial [Durusdinium trenchii]
HAVFFSLSWAARPAPCARRFWRLMTSLEDSAIWFNLTAQALGVRALKIVYKIHEGEHPQPICHPAAGGALCFTSFLMVDAWRSYVGKLASWPRRASSSARACFAFLFDEDAREECLLFCQSLSQQG